MMLSDTSKAILYSLLDNYLPAPFSASAFIVLWCFFLNIYTDSSSTSAFLHLFCILRPRPPNTVLCYQAFETKCSSMFYFPTCCFTMWLSLYLSQNHFLFYEYFSLLGQPQHDLVFPWQPHGLNISQYLFSLPRITFHFFFLIINPWNVFT